MTKKKIFPYELIGEEIEIIEAKNPLNQEVKGIVVDETKNIIKIKQGEKVKILLKEEIIFKIKRTGQVVVGGEIRKRPEDRLRGR